MTEQLQAAFKLARRQQYSAAVENEERGGNKSKPDFKPGDMLFVWARSSEESRIERADGKIVALPKKWVNPWIGPYKLVKWVSERKCLLDCNGKFQEFIVNRLSKHNRWDEVNPSTYAWSLKHKAKQQEPRNAGEEREEAPASEEVAEVFTNEYVFTKGEVIVFEQQISATYPIPFGVGVVTEHTKGDLVKFQWMGNSNNNEKGKWEPCWYQENEAKIYYSTNPLHRSHPANMGEDTDTRIRPDDVIMSSRGSVEILHMDKTKETSFKKLTAAAKKIIEANPYVQLERSKKNSKPAKHNTTSKEQTGAKRRKLGDTDEKHGR
jgi:hypothetical protein